MPTYKRPGVYVEEFLTASSPNLNVASTSTAAFVSPYNRGPSSSITALASLPTLCQSWNDFVQLYGGFGGTVSGAATSTYLAHGVYQFFAQGGRQAYVVRVLGTGGVKATRTLVDRAGSPLSTLSLTAANEGVWGNSIYIDIVDRTTGRFDLNVYFGGTASANLVEKWIDLSMVDSDTRYIVNIVNSTVAGSRYVVAADLASATVAPNDTPVAQIGTALATGADGSAPSTTQFANALATLDQITDSLILCAPSEVNTTNVTAMINYAEGRGDVFCLLDTAISLSVASAVTYAGAISPISSYAAVYWPWVNSIDPSMSIPNSTIYLPPSGIVAGVIARIDATRGVFKAPAGITARISGSVGLQYNSTNSDLDTLSVAQINAVRVIPGAGVCVFGTRTLKTTAADRYVPVRRTLIFVKKTLLNSTQFAAFEPNDSNLWTRIRSVCEQALTSLWQQGGLRGRTAAQAYYVRCDETNNTPATIAQGYVNIEIGVALQYPAEFVVIRIGQWEGGQSASEI